MSSIRNPLHLEIIPSPGTDTPGWEVLKKRIDMVYPFVESIHFDFLDGKFTNNTDFMEPEPFRVYAKGVHLEAHFMTEDPRQYIKAFADNGFSRFIGQVEQMPDIPAFLAEGQLYGEVGLAIDVDTPVELLFPYLEDMDVAFIMTVKAGLSQQSFLPTMLEKIGKLREKDALLPIEVDGGVNDENITAIKDAGATRFVSTGFIFQDEHVEEHFRKLKMQLT